MSGEARIGGLAGITSVVYQKFVTYFRRHSGRAGGCTREPESRKIQMRLDTRFRGHDGRETTDFFCEFLRQDTVDREGRVWKVCL